MSVQETTGFSGVAGRVVYGTLSTSSLVSGILLGLTVLISNWVLFTADAASLTTALNHVLFALVAARFVLNGQFGEWQGSLFSSAGGSWVEVLQVALRYLALNFLWLLPLVLAGLSPAIDPGAIGSKTIALTVIYLVASMLTPPVMLIVAVSADSFAELFSPEHWRRTFAGRISDLFAVYTTYTGGMAMAVLLAAPGVIAAFAVHVRFGAVVAGIALCFLLGMSLDLLGRLCGFFAVGELAAPEAGSPEPGLVPGGDLPRAAGPTIARPAAPPPIVATRRPAAPAPVAGPAAAPRPAAARPGASPTPPAAPPVASAKKPPLLNGKRHVDQIVAHFLRDPAGAIAALEDLRRSYAPDPQVLGALCICRFRSGQTDAALRLAGEALPLAFERGHSHLTADLFRELRPLADRLDLNREQILTIATAAAAKGDLVTAGDAYSMVLRTDSCEIRAIKGLLGVAERLLRELDQPAAAIALYRFLEQHCAGSPMAEHVSRGIAVAEKRLSRVLTPA